MSETVHDLGALRALREVGRHESIAAAAPVLGVSQQALSARMRTLERVMGIPLLARSSAGSHLTEQGRRSWTRSRSSEYVRSSSRNVATVSPPAPRYPLNFG